MQRRDTCTFAWITMYNPSTFINTITIYILLFTSASAHRNYLILACSSDFDWFKPKGVYLHPPNLKYVVNNANSNAVSNVNVKLNQIVSNFVWSRYTPKNGRCTSHYRFSRMMRACRPIGGSKKFWKGGGGGCSLSWLLLSTIQYGKGGATLKIAKNDLFW